MNYLPDVGEELVTTVVGDDVRSSTRVADVVPMAALPVSCGTLDDETAAEVT